MQFKFNKISYILLVFLGLTIFSQVYTSNKLATSGREIASLEAQAQNLEDENRRLLAENVEDLSLAELKVKAKELGFVEAESVINLSTGSNIASR